MYAQSKQDLAGNKGIQLLQKFKEHSHNILGKYTWIDLGPAQHLNCSESIGDALAQAPSAQKGMDGNCVFCQNTQVQSFSIQLAGCWMAGSWWGTPISGFLPAYQKWLKLQHVRPSFITNQVKSPLLQQGCWHHCTGVSVISHFSHGGGVGNKPPSKVTEHTVPHEHIVASNKDSIAVLCPV